MANKRRKFIDNIPEWWEEHWHNMPEFKQGNEVPFKEIIIKLKNKTDMEAFMELIGQKFTMKTTSKWYPAKETNWGGVNQVHYVDEDDKK